MLRKRGVWSETILVSATSVDRGNLASQSAETKTLSRTLLTRFSCLLDQVKHAPDRWISSGLNLAMKSLNMLTRGQLMLELFLSAPLLKRLKSPAIRTGRDQADSLVSSSWRNPGDRA